MEEIAILKCLLIIGGIVELIIGILFIFIDPFLTMMELENVQIFTQIAGIFIFNYGILLIFSSKDIERYLIIIVLNVFIRFMAVMAAISNLSLIPDFVPILLIAMTYDLLWAISVLILLIKGEFILKKDVNYKYPQ